MINSVQIEKLNRLRAAMARGKYSAADVARILERSTETVYGWLTETPNKNPRKTIPEMMLKFLELKANLTAKNKRGSEKRSALNREKPSVSEN